MEEIQENTTCRGHDKPLSHSPWESLFLLASLFFISYQALFYLYCIVYLSHGYTVTSSFDIDAAHHINLSRKATLFGDVGWYVYGPFFYKSAYFLGSLFKVPTLLTYGELAGREASLAFGFRLSSILSAYAFCLLLGRALYRKTYLYLTFAGIFFSSLLLNPTWQKFMFRVYPDALLSFLLGLSFLSALWSINHTKERARDVLSAPVIFSVVLWACAFHVKILALFFGPGLFLFLASRRVFSWYNAILIPVFILATLCLGYPTNMKIFNFWHTTVSSGLSFKGEFNSTWLSFYLNNYSGQAITPLLLVLLSTLLAPINLAWTSYRLILATLVSAGLPFVWLCLSPLDSPAEHYSMCLVTTHCVVFIPLIMTCKKGILRLSAGFSGRIGNALAIRKFDHAILLALISFLYLKVGFSLVQDAPLAIVTTTSHCADSVDEVKNVLHNIGGYIHRTPYTPRFHQGIKNVSFSPPWWDVTLSAINESSKGLMISPNFISRFLTKNHRDVLYVNKLFDASTIQSAATFASILTHKDSFEDLHGNRWSKKKSYIHCGFDLWIKQH